MRTPEVVVEAVALAALGVFFGFAHGALYGPDHAVRSAIVGAVCMVCIVVAIAWDRRRQGRTRQENPLDSAGSNMPDDEMSPEEPPTRPERWLD
jgi:hypothetical protein